MENTKIGKSRCFDRGISARRRRPQAVRQVRRHNTNYNAKHDTGYNTNDNTKYSTTCNTEYNTIYHTNSGRLWCPWCLLSESLCSLWPPVSTSMALRGARQKFLVGQQCALSGKKSFFVPKIVVLYALLPPDKFCWIASALQNEVAGIEMFYHIVSTKKESTTFRPLAAPFDEKIGFGPESNLITFCQIGRVPDPQCPDHGKSKKINENQ